MTICIATSNFPPQAGGIASFYGHLTSLLIKNGHSVIVLMPDENSTENDKDEIHTDGFLTKVLLRKQYAFYRKKYRQYFRPGGLDAPAWIAAGLAIKEWLSGNQTKYGIDILEVSDYGGMAAFFINELLPPVAITGHGSYTQVSRYNYSKNDRHSKTIRHLEKISFKLADAVIVGSPLNQKDLENLVGRQVEFSTTPFQVPGDNGITTNHQPPVIVGWLQKIKGSITTAESLRLCSSKKKNVQLDWIGGDTYTSPGFKRMSVFLEKTYPEIWGKSLIWHNEKTSEEVNKFIKEANFVIIPSEWETFNYVALEAAALGKAIIMTNKTGAHYLFTHGKDALIIPANNPLGLAEAILYLTGNPGICEALGYNAAITIKEKFNEKAIISERIEIYQKVISNRKQRSNSNAVDKFLEEIQSPGIKLYYDLRGLIKKLIGRK